MSDHEENQALNRRRRLRGIVRALCLLAAAALLLPAFHFDRWTAAVPAWSPLVVAAAVLTTWTFRPVLLLGLSVAIVAMFRRRWFCRWMCPTGLCLSGVNHLGMRLGRRCPKRVPPLGRWIAWVTLGGAAVGYPLLLWCDPLAIFCGLFGICLPERPPAAWAAAAALPSLLLLCLLMPGLWCQHFCPLGAFQNALFQAGRFLLGLFRNVNPADVSVEAAVRAKTRRRLLLQLVSASALGAAWAGVARAAHVGTPRRLRPPGARPDAEFLGLCVRCGNCIRNCPSRVLHYDLGENGVAGLLTPTIHFDDLEYCREDCSRCMEVCPSGALRLLDKAQVRIGLPHFDMDVCLASQDHECGVCRNRCPYDAIAMVFSESDYSMTPTVDRSKCTGCGACEIACPVKAINIRPLAPKQKNGEQERNEKTAGLGRS